MSHSSHGFRSGLSIDHTYGDTLLCWRIRISCMLTVISKGNSYFLEPL